MTWCDQRHVFPQECDMSINFRIIVIMGHMAHLSGTALAASLSTHRLHNCNPRRHNLRLTCKPNCKLYAIKSSSIKQTFNVQHNNVVGHPQAVENLDAKSFTVGEQGIFYKILPL